MRILVLGGTSEARQLCEQLAQRPALSVTVSLAGRTAAPAKMAVAVRTGGFGGAAGLAAYLAEQRIDL
ncbi:MAG: precorrin-6A/cobalt-precorrin-6A reductase, partial [Alphaproteobacteria bacterium]|nr:precorrin-6A/cobalt-precorrin-6A reductase [Alphaproteobacteria bacterium]